VSDEWDALAFTSYGSSQSLTEDRMKRLKQEISRRKRHTRAPLHTDRLKSLSEQLQKVPLPDSATLERWKRAYLAIREVCFELNNKRLVPSLPKDAIGFAASNVGMLHDNTIVMDTEDQIAILADFAIFNFRVNGKNAIQRYRELHAAELSPLQQQWFEGAENSRFTLLLLGESIPEIGVQANDVLTGEHLVITDVNFSRSTVAGLTVASRIIPIDDFYMTSGAPLPIFESSALLRIGQFLVRTCSDVKDFRKLPAERAMWMEAGVIRAILEEQGTERVHYANP
jgi:hypothetical protein